MRARAPLAAALALLAATAVADRVYDISDEQYYQMPELFQLDGYQQCRVYCVGSFELLPAASPHHLYQMMQRYSENWVDHFNHTRLHRGLCVSRACASTAPSALAAPDDPTAPATEQLGAWFASCVNASTMSSYNLSARLYQLDYCERGGAPSPADAPLNGSERVFAGVLAALVALAAVSTALDATLSDHAKKNAEWALSWSLQGGWRSLQQAPAGAGSSLAVLDGLRVLGLLCFIVVHVVYLNTLTYIINPRRVEQMRRDTDVVLMSNCTLMVQAFFVMSSFLLANKLLGQRRRQQRVAPLATLADTMLNRFVRLSPTYFIVVWFAASWWSRASDGPMWAPLVGVESGMCRHKWWTHLLYLNNVLYNDDRCLIQTWYLAADMQLYLCALVLTLALWRLRRAALLVLAALLAAAVLAAFGLAYAWRLVPNFVVHRPEAIRTLYRSEPSFDAMYQSPLGNAPGMLVGLLLAHLHHAFIDANVRPAEYTWFRWATWCAPWGAMLWMVLSPRLLGAGPPARAAAAALAAFERPVFALLVALALLGAMHGVKSPVQRVLSWRGWAVPARLSFGALLLHMVVNKSLLGVRWAPTQLGRLPVILEWFGVAVASYMAALPLALLVEIPGQRLYRALRAPPPAPPQGAAPPPPEKTNM